MLTCNVTIRNTEEVDIFWTGPVGILPPLQTSQSNPETNLVMSTLTVNLTNSSLEGSYNCTATYSNCSGSVTSNSSVLTILLPPSITSGPMEVGVVNISTNISLSCTATNFGTVISWTGPHPNLQSVTIDSGTENVISTLDLSIEDVSYGGEYTCIASNAAGSDSASVVIFVIPEVVSVPPDLLISIGENVTLVCMVQDEPRGVITWEKLNESGVFEVVENEAVANLTFSPVMFGNEGTYRCVSNTSQFGELPSLPSLLTGIYNDSILFHSKMKCNRFVIIA